MMRNGVQNPSLVEWVNNTLTQCIVEIKKQKTKNKNRIRPQVTKERAHVDQQQPKGPHIAGLAVRCAARTLMFRSRTCARAGYDYDEASEWRGDTSNEMVYMTRDSLQRRGSRTCARAGYTYDEASEWRGETRAMGQYT